MMEGKVCNFWHEALRTFSVLSESSGTHFLEETSCHGRRLPWACHAGRKAKWSHSFPLLHLLWQLPNTYICPLSLSLSHVPTGLLPVSAWKSHSTSITVLILETAYLISSPPKSLPSLISHLGNWFQHLPSALFKIWVSLHFTFFQTSQRIYPQVLVILHPPAYLELFSSFLHLHCLHHHVFQ